MTAPTDALAAYAAADPVPDPALLPLQFADATAFVEAHRPHRSTGSRTASPGGRRGGGIRRVIVAIGALCFAAAAMGAVAAGIWTLVRTTDEPDTVAGTTVPPATTAPTTPTTTRPAPTTTTTEPPTVIQPNRVVGAGSSYNGSFPAIALMPDGLPVLAHVDDEGPAIRIAVCADRACATLAGDTDVPIADWSEPHHLIVGLDGIPLLVYVDADDAGGSIVRLARCRDATCEDHTVRDVGPGSSPSLALRPDGLPIIAFGNSLEETAVLARCTDAACADDFDTTVIEGIRWRLGPLALTGGGVPLIAQVTVRSDGSSILRVASCTDPACTEVATSDLGAVPASAAVAGAVVGPTGIATIFVTDPGTEVLAFRCLDAGCTSASAPASLAGRRPIGDTIGTAWGDGAPVVVSANAGSGLAPTNSGWLFRCDDPGCAAGIVVELPGLQGIGAAVALDEDGAPVVFFHRPRSGGFVLRCDVADCTDIAAATQVPWSPESVAASFEGLGPTMEGWERATLERDEGGGGVVAIARSPGLLVAVGHDCEFRDGISECRPMAWAAQDPALWRPASRPPGGEAPITTAEALTDVVATAAGFLAAGTDCTATEDGTRCTAAMWTSSDGLEWDPIEDPPGRETSCGPDSPAGCRPAEFELVATTEVTIALATATDNPLAWWSVDGRAWTPAALPAPSNQTWLIDGTATESGLIAFGGSCRTAEDDGVTDLRCSAVLWRSDDGRRWSIEDTGSTFDNALLASLAPAHGGYFATGESCDTDWRCRPTVWWSVDGIDWETLPEAEAFEDAIDATTLAPWGPVGAPPSLDRVLVVATAIDDQRGLERGVFLIGSYQGASSWRRLVGDPDVFGSGRLGIIELVPLTDATGATRFVAVGADRLGPAIWLWDAPDSE